MPKLDLSKFIEDSTNIKLSQQEKTEILSYLKTTIAQTPVKTLITKARLNSFGFLNVFFRPIPMTIALVLIISAGTSLAAEHSLPGDNLYSIKTKINEPARSLFAFSDSAKATREANLAGNRLEEAEQLAVKGDIDDKTQELLEKSFAKHADRAQEGIKKIQIKDTSKATAVSSSFTNSLDDHVKTLNKLSSSSENKFNKSKLQISKLTMKIKDRKKDIEKDEDDNKSKFQVKNSKKKAENLKARSSETSRPKASPSPNDRRKGSE